MRQSNPNQTEKFYRPNERFDDKSQRFWKPHEIQEEKNKKKNDEQKAATIALTYFAPNKRCSLPATKCYWIYKFHNVVAES